MNFHLNTKREPTAATVTLAFMTLGFVIEEISGQPALNDYLQKKIYEPLKMKDTMFTPNRVAGGELK